MGVSGQRGTGIPRPLGLVSVYGNGPRRGSLQAMSYRPCPCCSQPTGGPGVFDKLFVAAVADDAARRQHVGDRDRREEPSCILVVDRSVTRHVQQRGGCCPTGRGHQQIALKFPTVGQFNTLDGFGSPAGCHDVVALAGIHHRHVHTGPVQVCGGGVPIGVGREYHRGVARPHRVHVHETPHRTREHHSRLVVAIEHVGSLDQTRRNDQNLGPGLDEPLDRDRMVALDDAGPVVLVAPGDGGVGQHLYPCGHDCGGEVGGQGPVAVIGPEEVATQMATLLHQQHPRPGLGGREGGGHPGRTPAGHHHIRVGVTLVVVPARRIGVDPPSG